MWLKLVFPIIFTYLYFVYLLPNYNKTISIFRLLLYLIGYSVLNSMSQSAPREGSSFPIGATLWAAEADMRQWWWEPGGELRSWNEAHTRSSSHRVVASGSGRGSTPLKLKAAPAEWRAPSMRRLALILLPCAVAVLVHLWLAQRPSSTPLDNNTHSGTFLETFFYSLNLKPRNFLSSVHSAPVFVVADSLCLEQVVDACWFERVSVQDSVCSHVCLTVKSCNCVQ